MEISRAGKPRRMAWGLKSSRARDFRQGPKVGGVRWAAAGLEIRKRLLGKIARYLQIQWKTLEDGGGG